MTATTKKAGKLEGTKATEAKAPAKGKAPIKTEEKGYKGHNAGSRKEAVHKLFDSKGAEAAKAHGLEIGLKAGTLASWFGAWARAKLPAKSEPKVA